MSRAKMDNVDKLVIAFCDELIDAEQGDRTAYALNAAAILLEFAEADRRRVGNMHMADQLRFIALSLQNVRQPKLFPCQIIPANGKMSLRK